MQSSQVIHSKQAK